MQTIPLNDYLADPAPEPSFSSGAANAIVHRSPLHAWWEHPRLGKGAVESNEDMDVGAAAHALFLESDPSRFVTIDAKDWRTKAAKEARQAAWDAGNIPLLRHQRLKVDKIVEASQRALDLCSELSGIWDDAHIECSWIWQEYTTWCRARPDLVSKDLDIVLNYKTTGGSASPEQYRPDHLQAYHHAQAVTSSGVPLPRCLWLVQETKPPYGASILGMSPSLLALAGSQWSQALGVWRCCLREDSWPGYPSRVCWVEAKPWELERMSDIERVECPHGVDVRICAICRGDSNGR